MNLNQDVKITRVVVATAAGATAVNGSVLDMTGFDGVMFVACFGALTATQVTSLKAQQSDASDGSGMADLLGSDVGPLADANGTRCLALDVVRPRKRYVRCVVVRSVANAVIDAVIAIQYGATTKPTVQDATTIIAHEVTVSPAEGTA